MSFSFSDFASKSKSSILLIGRPGSGKTVLMSQFPKPFIIECDNNAKGPVNFVQNLAKAGKKVSTSAKFDIPHIIFNPDGSQTTVPRNERFKRFSKIATEVSRDPEIETVCIDSITTWTDYVFDEVRVQQKKKIAGINGATADDPLSQPDWGCFYGVAKNFIIDMKSLGKRVVFASHIDTRLDESAADTKNWMEYIAIPGALREQVSGLFDEVWVLDTYTKTTSSGVEIRRRLRTSTLDFRQAGLGLKTGLGFAAEFDVDFEAIAAKV
jgi:hypothetical protein